MNSSDFIHILQNPEALNVSQSIQLQNMIKQYPYFQSPKVLLLKNLFNENSLQYNSKLKNTAAYTTDRSILFDFINSDHFNQHAISKKIAAQIKLNNIEVTEEEVRAVKDVFKEEDYAEAETVLNPNTFVPAAPVEEDSIEEKEKTTTLPIGKPLDFSNERHSFTQWLQLSKVKPIIRDTSALENTDTTTEETSPIDDNRKDKFSLIDKFLETSPKITPVKEPTNMKNLAKEVTMQKTSLMTETLARVYLEQKKYQDAIKAYEILILKYPEKSSLFADQIEQIKKLKQNN